MIRLGIFYFPFNVFPAKVTEEPPRRFSPNIPISFGRLLVDCFNDFQQVGFAEFFDGII